MIYMQIRIQNFLRQTDVIRDILYKDYFDASAKTFADANPKWALSADTKNSNAMFGYVFGVFYPAWDYHRFFKIGFGYGISYVDFSATLNLCSQYSVSEGSEEDGTNYIDNCVGKREWVSTSYQGYAGVIVGSFTLWERRTKDTIWRFLDWKVGLASAGNKLKIKNVDKKFGIYLTGAIRETISFTYRF